MGQFVIIGLAAILGLERNNSPVNRVVYNLSEPNSIHTTV